MSTKALKKELLVAVVMLLVAAVALSGSTYAWFAINNTVTAEGLTVHTQTSNNLFIAPLAAGATAIPADNQFVTSDTTTVARTMLEPTSSHNAVTTNYWYNLTSNTNGQGSRTLNTIDYVDYDLVGLAAAVDSTNYTNKFSENYEVTKSIEANGAKGYLDYEFALKAVNADPSVDYHINLDKIALRYAGAIDGSKAYRVAIFYQEADAAGATVKADLADGTAGSTLLDIKSVSGAAYFNNANGAVSAADTLTAVTSLNTANANIPVAHGTTKYYKVLVRLWLEGEDTTCNNTTFMNLRSDWVLDLRFKLENAAGGQQYVTEYTTATVSGTTYYYDKVGGHTWTNLDEIGDTAVATAPTYKAITAVSSDVQTAFGYNP